MISEGWNIVKTAALWYFSNGYVWFLLVCACIVIFLTSKKGKAKYLVWYVAVYSILVFNPVSAIVLSKFGMDGVYWRSFWMIPTGCLIACAMTYLIAKPKKQIYRGIVLVISIVAIVVCGKQIYTRDNFQKTENWYKIPQEVIEVSKYIETGNTVLAPIDLLVWFRTYNADIYLPIGRQEYYFSTNDEKKQLINSLSWDETVDVSYIATNAIDYGCRYIVIRKQQTSEGDWNEYGYQLAGETETYLIYKR